MMRYRNHIFCALNQAWACVLGIVYLHTLQYRHG